MSYQEPPYDPYYQQQDPYQQQQPYQQPYQQPQSPYPYQQQPFPQSYPPPMVSSGQTNVMAILSLVFAFVFSPLAIVFGHIAKKQIKERGEDGDGLATAGLVLGYIFTGISVAICAFWVIAVVFLASAGHSTSTY
ncbi:MAG: hypothetical protein AUI10_05725 [Actinobacteria bacterium 13_2_20CM_2_72_6]|nr:MAG: hypothetical protein AUI10_05725 [Actinobacteria bacterium 13_2_20CM_2_72_6]